MKTLCEYCKINPVGGGMRYCYSCCCLSLDIHRTPFEPGSKEVDVTLAIYPTDHLNPYARTNGTAAEKDGE